MYSPSINSALRMITNLSLSKYHKDSVSIIILFGFKSRKRCIVCLNSLYWCLLYPGQRKREIKEVEKLVIPLMFSKHDTEVFHYCN